METYDKISIARVNMELLRKDVEREGKVTLHKTGAFFVLDIDKAIACALEKQLPKKPVAFKRTAYDYSAGICEHSHCECEYLKSFKHEYRYTDYKCPVCGSLLSDGTLKFCCHCGQALDWSDE